MFLLNLYGCVNAENKVMILFNIRNDRVPDIEQYLRENNLFADEPTMNVGKLFTEFSIQVDKNDVVLPLAKIRFELAQRKAVNIDTIPVNSSIPTWKYWDFNPNSAIKIVHFAKGRYDLRSICPDQSGQMLSHHPTHSAFLPAVVYGTQAGVHFVPIAESGFNIPVSSMDFCKQEQEVHWQLHYSLPYWQ